MLTQENNMNTKDIEEWERVAARTALDAHKLTKNYAQFSECIYQGFKQITQHRQAEVGRAIKEEIEVERSNFVEILENLREMVDGTDRMVEEYIDDMIVGLTLTPTKTDKQTEV